MIEPAIITALVFTTFSILCHEKPATLPDKLDARLHQAFPDSLPGIAYALIQGDSILYRGCFGAESMETHSPNTPASNFRMASVSKQFTAMAILLLEKQGSLSLDDPLLKFFPDFNPKVGQAVALRHLLTHTSGLWDYESLIPEERSEQVDDADVVAMVKTMDTTYFAPGTQFRYSNTGFCILAEIVAGVSGQPYGEFMRERLFQPLGMEHTFIYNRFEPQSERALGYKHDAEEGRILFSDQSVTSATKGDGCVYTSLNDYERWARALIDSRPVDLDTALERCHFRIYPDKGLYYGCGWFFHRDAAGKLELFHTGSTCGFSNHAIIVPDRRLIEICFSNQADNHAIHRAIDSLLEQFGAPRAAYPFWPADELTQ